MGISDENPNLDIDSTYGCYTVFLSTFMFACINWIIKVVGPPESLRADEWRWRNLTVSWINAVICSVWVSISMATEPEMFLELKYYKSYSIVFLSSMATGYYLYDTLDIILKGRITVADGELILHHVVIGSSYFYTLAIAEWLPFLVIVTASEINTCFLHARKLMQMVGTPFSSRRYRLLVYLNLITFPIFRGIPLFAMIWASLFLGHQARLLHHIFAVISSIVMFVIQVALFYRLVRSDFRKREPAESCRNQNEISHYDRQAEQHDISNGFSSLDPNHDHHNGYNHLKSN